MNWIRGMLERKKGKYTGFFAYLWEGNSRNGVGVSQSNKNFNEKAFTQTPKAVQG